MVMARLHVLCGNCGCNDEFKYEIDLEGRDVDGDTFEPEVYITCRNCSTIHTLSNTIEESKRQVSDE